MSLTTGVYPLAVKAINNGTIKLTSDTFAAMLCTGSAATFSTTQYAYQYVSDIKTAYTECADADYTAAGSSGRITLTSMALARATDVVTWSCGSPITWGSDVSIAAASLFVYDVTAGAGDSTYPVICYVDFGATETSVSGTFEYTCSSGLATWTG